MTSANDTPGGDFDERLAQAIDAALIEGEQLVAQETGDQGQAIALTKSRILVVKAGFAATGELDGHKVSAFDLEKVTSVNLRKGPLGAVIQICAEGSAASAQGGPPDNVIVFTGPGRVKRAEAFAAQIEILSGTTVNRVDPSPRPETPPVQVQETPTSFDGAQDAAGTQQAEASQPEAPARPKGGRKPKSLAEEIYGEVVEAGKASAAQNHSARAEASQSPAETAPAETTPEQMAVEVVEEVPEPSSEYRPNPRLPRPTRKQKTGPSGILVILGVAAALVLIGMAVMAPVRQAQNDTGVVVDRNSAAGSKAIKSQLVEVTKYRDRIAPLLAKSDSEAATMRSAVRSGNKAAVKAIGEAEKTDLALDGISGLPTPPGLAEAGSDLTSGLLAQKTAIANAAAAAQTGSLPAQETLKWLDEANAQIRKGMSAITQAQSQLEKQAAGPASPKSK